MFFPHVGNTHHGGIGDTPNRLALAVGDALEKDGYDSLAQLHLAYLISIAGKAIIQVPFHAVAQDADIEYVLLCPNKSQCLSQSLGLDCRNFIWYVAQVKVLSCNIKVTSA